MPLVVLDHRMDVGGVGRYGRLLASGLRALSGGPRVEVVDRQTSTSPLAAPFTPWGRALVAARARRSDADLIHSLHLELPRARVPLVVTIHDLIPLDVPEAMARSWRRAMFRRLLDSAVERAAAVVVPSENTRAALLRRGIGVPVEVIPNAIDPMFEPLTEDARTAARRRFAGGSPYVAAVADARAHKTPSALIGAARAIEGATRRRVLFTGVAQEPFPRSACVGWLDDADLVSFLAGADLFLLPSRSEGFGLPLAEAAACGTPGIATREVGAVDYLGRGVVLTEAEASAVADAAIGLLGDEGELAERARAALAAAGELTVERMAAATWALYARLLS